MQRHNCLLVFCLLMLFSSNAQLVNNTIMRTDTLKNNPLLCDPATGICSVSYDSTTSEIIHSEKEKPLRLIYFTDPICSSCWGIEPQLRKLKLVYGDVIDIEYRMGGLLPDWSYSSGGINGPKDVAHHWEEVSLYYDMPITGDVWLEDPLHSSYPPSIAFKAAQLQSEEKAVVLMRIMREMVFMQKKNIAKWEHIAAAAEKAGLNLKQLKTDFDEKARLLFEADLKLAKQYGVRGFPTMFFVNRNGEQEMAYGSKPYSLYENAVLKLYPQATKNEYNKDWKSLFAKYPSLTAKEFATLSGTSRNEAEKILDELVQAGHLKKHTVKNGAVWMLKGY